MSSPPSMSSVRILHIIPVIVLIIFAHISTSTNPECFDDIHNDVEQRLATKTPYRLLANHDVTPPAYPGCTATRIWSVIRHGTRRPNRRILHAMSNRLVQWRQSIVDRHRNADASEQRLCDRDVHRFEQWQPRVAESDEMQLADEGHTELVQLAERMQLRFGDLLPDVYRNESFLFKFTDTQRTRKSFEAFATGLFGNNNIYNIWHPPPSKKDPVLRFYKLCPRWALEVSDNPLAVAEVDAFRRSDAMLAAIRSVSQRLGQDDSTLLSADEVHLIYKVCAFETAWYRSSADDPSPWCTLLDAASLRTIEYLEDLEYYHIDGYATALTYQQACPALNDMLHRLTANDEVATNNVADLLSSGPDPVKRPARKSTKNAGIPPATLYFTHSGTMLKILALLGLYRDGRPLTGRPGDDDADVLATFAERQWRVGRIDAFASNLAFVMYNCTTNDDSNTAAPTFTPHLLVQHQERTVRLDGCPTDSDLCPLIQFRSIYRHALGEACRFDEMCSIPSKTTTTTPKPEAHTHNPEL